jgi:hypothetical protein
MSVTITTVGTTITTGAASANAAIPVASSGEIPRYIRLSATVACHAKLGTSVAVAATANDTLIMPNDSLILVVPRGVTHIAAIQNAAAGQLNVVPLEDC